MNGTGKLYLNGKLLGTATAFKLNIEKEPKMKRKHVIENLENEVRELKSSLEAKSEQDYLISLELERLEGVIDRLSDENDEIKRQYSDALTLIGNLTSSVKIN